MGRIISATNPLYPISVVNTKTGELLNKDEYEGKVRSLLEYVQTETQILYAREGERLVQEILATKRIGSPNSFARQRNYASSYKTLPQEILAKSRVNELVLHKLVSETASYARNLNPRKQLPSFSLKVNLGGVDKQMASLSYDPMTQHLFLEWACWDVRLLFEFWLPGNILSKNIKKWSLPSVQFEKGELAFRFTIEEHPTPREGRVREIAGLDLGITQPYTLVVLNEKGERTADYKSSKGLSGLSAKRSRLLKNKKHITQKIQTYEQLGISTEVLRIEASRVASKIQRLGTTIAQKLGGEVASKLAKHKLNTLIVEDLTWVKGAKYGGRWNHSAQQASLTHALAKKSVRVRRVNPKNTSQVCSKCGAQVVHNATNRTVHCQACSLTLDRDYNAAINIIRKCPAYTSMNGDNRTTNNIVEVMVGEPNPPTHPVLRTPT